MRPDFQPRDPEFAEKVSRSFARQSAMGTMGIDLVEVGPGWVEMSLERQETLTQQHGFVHAGVIATAMDSACGYSAFSLMRPDAAVLTVEYKINLLEPAEAERFRVAGWVVKPGRTLTVCQATTTPWDGGPPTATMTATIMTLLDSGLTE